MPPPERLEAPHGRGGGGYRPLTPEERQAKDEDRRTAMRAGVTAHFEALAGELAQGKSDRLKTFLTCSANHIRFSAANQELIFSQRPDASFVATFPTWTREYNRAVKRGEKAIWVLQPRPYETGKKEAPASGTGEGAEGEAENDAAEPTRRSARVERGTVGISFRPLAVFDVSQTESIAGLPVKDLPVFFTPLEGLAGIEVLNERLKAAMELEGIRVGETIYTEGAEGYNLPNVVMTREGLAPTNKALVRIHEWTHNLLHRTEESRYWPKGKKECHAEAVAYIVMRHLTGFESPFTA